MKKSASMQAPLCFGGIISLKRQYEIVRCQLRFNSFEKNFIPDDFSSTMAGPQPKKARFTLRMDDDAEMTSLHSKLDAIAVQLGPQATRKTALWHLIDSFSSSATTSGDSLSKQIFVEKADHSDQLYIGEVQQLNMLVNECRRWCRCGSVSWKISSCKMQGHVLSCSILCSTCSNSRRWLSSSILGTRYTVNAR